MEYVYTLWSVLLLLSVSRFPIIRNHSAQHYSHVAKILQTLVASAIVTVDEVLIQLLSIIVYSQTRAEYYTLYRDAQRSGGARFIPEHSLIYDSVWTLALALNSTLANQNPASNSCASGLPLEDFTYGSASLGRELRDAVSRTNFNGASVSCVVCEMLSVHNIKVTTVCMPYVESPG